MNDGGKTKVSVASSANSSAEERELGRWQARPNVVRLIRFLVVAVPIAMSVLALRVATMVVPQPAGSLATAFWFTAAVGVAYVTLRAVNVVAKRFLPLAALFRFSLVFPDRAPARFSVALRTGTTRQLENRLAEMREHPDDVDLVVGAETLLSLVARISDHDRLTRGHSERVRAFSDMIAEELDLPETDREKLHWSALLHDVGKLQVSADILSKSGELTESEWAEIHTHPSLGGELLDPLKPWLGDWIRAAAEHHERWDGAGYPNGLRGEEISLAGRIVAVADAYDVMTAARSYKEPCSPEKARSELAANSGTQFDPAVVRAFLNVSVGRVKAVAGPVAWFSQFPGLAQTASTVASTSGAAATAAALTALTVTAGIGSVGPAESDREVPELADLGSSPTSIPPTTTAWTPEGRNVEPLDTVAPIVISPDITVVSTTTAPIAAPTTIATTSTVAAATTTSTPVTTTLSSVEILDAVSSGGSATLSFTDTAVDVVSISPAPGFIATVTRINETHVQIRFTNGIVTTRIKARWKDGAALIEILQI